MSVDATGALNARTTSAVALRDIWRAEFVGALVGTLWLVAVWMYSEPRVNPWIDEIFTSMTARRGLVGAFQHALTYQSQPPVYYLLAAIAWTVDPSIRALRVVSLIGAIMCVWMMIPLGRQLRFGAFTGVLVLASAMLPLVQRYSVEARPYSWSMALVAGHVAAVLWMMSTENARDRRWAIAATVVSAVVAMLTFYYSALVVALAMGTALVGWPGYRRRLITAGAIISLLMLPVAFVIVGQLSVIADNYPVIRAGRQNGSAMQESWQFLHEGVFGAAISVRPLFIPTVLLCATALLLRGMWGRARSASFVNTSLNQSTFAPTLPAMYLLLSAGIGTVAILLALRGFNVLMVWPRYLVIASPLLAATAIGLVLGERVGVMRTFEWTGLGALLFALQASHLRNLPIRFDHRPSALLVESLALSGEPLLVSNFNYVLVFLHAYRGRNQVVPLPVDTNSVRYRMRDVFVEDPVRVAARVDSAVQQVSGFWWLRPAIPTLGVPETESIIRARSRAFVVALDTVVLPTRITHFVRRPDAFRDSLVRDARR